MANVISSTLYDESEQAIYPVTYAQFVHSEAIGGSLAGDTVHANLVYLNSLANRALALASGAELVQNLFGVLVKYMCNASLTPPTVDDNGWSETFSPPTSQFPYAWKKTTYTWDSVEVITLREIVTTALFPETLVMYTTLQSPPQSGGLKGPVEYTSDSAGSRDTEATNVVWRNYFTGISASEIYGYMAVRHRDAGQPFPDDGAWNISLFTQYPIINS